MKHVVQLSTFERVDERGVFREIVNSGPWETVIHGQMNQNAVMGNHYHRKTQVFFFLTYGAVNIKTIHVESGERDEFTLQANQGVLLRSNESHAIRFLEESGFILLKSHRYNPDDPDTFSYPVPE